MLVRKFINILTKVMMKKLYSLVTFACLIAFFACNKESVPSVNNIERSTAYQEMRKLNDSLLLTSSRAINWSCFLRACTIAGADFMGAGAGIASTKEIAALVGAATGGTGAAVVCAFSATICAVGASAAAYDACTRAHGAFSPDSLLWVFRKTGPDPVEDESLRPSDLVQLPSRFEYLRNVGIIHNNMLATLDDIKSGNIDINDAIPDADPYLEAIVLSDEFQEAYDVIISASIIKPNESIDVAHYVEINGIKLSIKAARVYELFTELYSQFPENEYDVVDVVNAYISIIENSDEFSDEEKESIYIGLMVAAESPMYWQNKFE